MEKKRFIEAGRITNTHGIAGEVKIEVWLDSPRYFKTFKRLFIDGREERLRSSPRTPTRTLSSQSSRARRT